MIQTNRQATDVEREIGGTEREGERDTGMWRERRGRINRETEKNRVRQRDRETEHSEQETKEERKEGRKEERKN